jgi:hypothetical protein
MGTESIRCLWVLFMGELFVCGYALSHHRRDRDTQRAFTSGSMIAIHLVKQTP